MYMRDLDYLKLLQRSFPDETKAKAEIINLRAILNLPKGTEYFFSDLHGEYEAFSFLLRSASGEIRNKIKEIFSSYLSEAEQLRLANIIYYPKDMLRSLREKGIDTEEFQSLTLHQLITVGKEVSKKYSRSKVRKKMDLEYAYAIDELLHSDLQDRDKKQYYEEIIQTIIAVGQADEFIVALSDLIRTLTVDHLHIIGDIFDRGPRADKIMEELCAFKDIDIQWGNHDIEWIGASLGNRALIASVLRIAMSYNSFDVLEQGYGINLRPLSMFAKEVYDKDECRYFYPHLLDGNVSDFVSPELVSKMHKAISIILFKEEGKLLLRHPEYRMEDRLLLDKIDIDTKTIRIQGKSYPLNDIPLETVDFSSPYELTDKEEELMKSLVYSFTHSEKLKKHVDFLISHGGMYKVFNGNLLFHGCIPMNQDGSFLSVSMEGKEYSGKALMDYFDRKVREIYFKRDRSPEDADLFYYLWAGAYSPLFGKDRLAAFENLFIKDNPFKETMNPYYSLSRKEEVADSILAEFSLPIDGHIINGHVPVNTMKGDSAVRSNGKVFVIDGGISKAYHAKTGICGYTLISTSHHIALAVHRVFEKGNENTPEIKVVEPFMKRIRVKDTDKGSEILAQISDLNDLLKAYEEGLIDDK